MELGDTYSDFNSGGPGAGAAGVEAGADARRQGDFWGWSGRRAKAGVAAMAVAATEVATRVIRTGTEDDMPRRDANIWSLYLVEAEKKVKRQADLWNTNLEYLLVFVSCSFAVSETDTNTLCRLVCLQELWPPSWSTADKISNQHNKLKSY